MSLTDMGNLSQLRLRAQALFPGVMVSILVAVSAKFLSEHYATPAMLLALLLGIAVSFLSEDSKTEAGIGFAARTLLRVGVALLGARISLDLLMGLGAPVVFLLVAGVLCTIGFSLLIGRWFHSGWRFSLLTGASVAICGASAALAVAAILPKDDRSEERLIFTVVSVTVLSTIAMILYPIVVSTLGLTVNEGAVFLGGTIHDVAQVVGAGFSISQETGETATLVKLIRVSMLAPIVLIASILIRSLAETRAEGERPPLLPGFVIGFLALAVLNSANVIPAGLSDALGQTSRWLLLIAIAAVGMKTNLKQVLSVGPAAIALIIANTAFIGIFILAGMRLIP